MPFSLLRRSALAGLYPALCLSLGLGAASAQAFDGCSVSPADYADVVAPALEGSWTAANGAGTMWAFQGGQMLMSMPMPPAEPAVTEIALRDGRLILSGGDFTELEGVLLAGSAVPEPDLPEGAGGEPMDADALAAAPGCDTAALPVLMIEGAVPMEDAPGTAEFVMYLYAVDAATLAGTFTMSGQSQGMTIQARRFVTLTR